MVFKRMNDFESSKEQYKRNINNNIKVKNKLKKLDKLYNNLSAYNVNNISSLDYYSYQNKISNLNTKYRNINNLHLNNRNKIIQNNCKEFIKENFNKNNNLLNCNYINFSSSSYCILKLIKQSNNKTIGLLKNTKNDYIERLKKSKNNYKTYLECNSNKYIYFKDKQYIKKDQNNINAMSSLYKVSIV